MAIQKNDAGLFQTDIDGRQYEFAKWGADLALGTFMDVSTVAGKPIAALLGATGGKSDAELTVEALDALMGALTTSLGTNRETVLRTVKLLCCRDVLCDHKPVGNFDLQFKGALGHIFRVARANLEVQFGDFLAELGVNAASVKLPTMTPGAQPSSSPTVLSAVPTQP